MIFRKVLILIPAYNEEKKIFSTVTKVKNVGSKRKWAILVVDDGSKDLTAELAKKAGAEVVSHPFNMGYGVALQTGYKYALTNNFEAVIQIDADGQHDPKYLPKMLGLLKTKKADLVIGSRFKKRLGYKAPLTRRIGMIFFSLIVLLVTKKKITDPTSGYQAINGRLLPFLTSDFFPCDFPDADLIIMLYFAGYKVIETPMKMYQNEEGKSMHGSFTKNIYYVAKMCLSILTILMRKITKLPNK
jgi:glycosyltransferase involved in cell wall biosynthesis